jgi:ribosome-associated protein
MRKKPFSDAPDFDDLEDRPSRTEQKKAMARLQQLGERLAALPLETIQALPVNDALTDALIEYNRIPSFEARRRQSQLICKLLKREDEGAILATMNIKQPAKKLAQIVRWVDRLVAQGDGALNDFVRQFPAAERHTLRQHVLRVLKAKADELTEEEVAEKVRLLENYVHEVALLSE